MAFCLVDVEIRSTTMTTMPARKYRTLQKPLTVSNITAEEATELARIVAARFAARRSSSAKRNGSNKTIAASKITHSPKSSSGAVGKSTRSKSQSTRESVAKKR